MGKIKSKLVRRSAHELIKRGVVFTGNFNNDKKVLGMTMPSKKIRNQIAGFLSRMKKNGQKLTN